MGSEDPPSSETCWYCCFCFCSCIPLPRLQGTHKLEPRSCSRKPSLTPGPTSLSTKGLPEHTWEHHRSLQPCSQPNSKFHKPGWLFKAPLWLHSTRGCVVYRRALRKVNWFKIKRNCTANTSRTWWGMEFRKSSSLRMANRFIFSSNSNQLVVAAWRNVLRRILGPHQSSGRKRAMIDDWCLQSAQSSWGWSHACPF